MSKIIRSIIICTLTFTLCTLSLFSTAFALTDEESKWLEENTRVVNDQGVTGSKAWMKNWLVSDPSKSDSSTPLFTTSSGEQVYLAKGKTEEDLAEEINRTITGDKTVDNVSNITDGLNISADTAGAAAMLNGFAPIISLILGLMATLVTIGMTISSAIDIAYIAFPVFRNKCEDAKAQGTGAMVKKGSNGETSLRFVTDDAQYAISQGTIESGKSPWTIYFGRRVFSYIVLAIILFILLTGNISLITDIALKVVSGIMDVLGGLA